MNSSEQRFYQQLTLERMAAQTKLGRLAIGPSEDPVVDARQRALLLQKVRSIDAALRRLEDGAAYGLCRQCGHAIPPDRLALMPYAELCVTCQKQLEQRTLGHRTLSPVTQAAR